MTNAAAPTFEEIFATARRLSGHLRRTPVLEIDGEEVGVPGRIALKLEQLQHSGSFKARGALNALLTRHVPSGGVVTASGGNHGAAVAWAGRHVGVPVTVFLPTTSSPEKAARIASFGARVERVAGFYAEAAVAAAVYAADHDVLSVHAYDEPAVVAGQATVGLEIREQVPDATAVLVGVGGGGLVSGVTLACAGHSAVVPVEPERCPTLHTALAKGGPTDVEVGGVAADSMGARRIGSIAYRVLSAAGAQVRQVSDEEIVAAQRFLWDRFRLVTEPGGATAFAGLLSGAYRPEPGDTVAVVLCGANTAALPG